MTVQSDRQLVAAIIGVEFANSIADEQLPALVHAVEEDALMVAACAKQAQRKGVDNPPSLLMWLIRERKHTGLIPVGAPVYKQPELIPPREPLTPEQEAYFAQWKRIWKWQQHKDIAALIHAYTELYPTPTEEQAHEIRDGICAVIDEMEAVSG